MPAWWKATADGGTIRVRVQPRAGSDAVVGPMPDGSLKVRIAAPPVDSAANEALVRFLAARLGVSRSAVVLVRGATSRSKVVAVRGVDGPTAAARLTPG